MTATNVPGLAALDGLGIGNASPRPATSDVSFPDGGAWRVEIPSVEGPEALATVLEAADRLSVPIHRVSQGSGVFMLTDAELGEMTQVCGERQIEFCPFVRPGANWDTGAARDSPAGSLGARTRGRDGLAAGIAEAERAVAFGVRSLLVADEGLLWTLHRLRSSGLLPSDLQLKVSVMAGTANPAGLQVLERLGADTVNVPSDLSVSHLAELRSASFVTMDLYVEAPDNIGGFVRHYEIAEIIRVAAPVYVKFGLRNAPDVYPAGQQLRPMVLAASAERVRRARIGLDLLERSGDKPAMSPLGSRAQPRTVRFAQI